ncbi:hypothetical protein [Actinophytocola sp.]|uniref:hypothetical protein n=1 Tax=Actinophytocola sp. TaxID=1872138 RepID=UPI00389A649D
MRLGLAALVLGFGGWLVVANIDNPTSALRVVAFAPAILLGTAAFFGCTRALLTTPESPPRPPPPNPPILSQHMPAWHEVVRIREVRYQQELEASRTSPAQAVSLVLGAVSGLAVVYCALVYAAVL